MEDLAGSADMREAIPSGAYLPIRRSLAQNRILAFSLELSHALQKGDEGFSLLGKCVLDAPLPVLENPPLYQACSLEILRSPHRRSGVSSNFHHLVKFQLLVLER